MQAKGLKEVKKGAKLLLKKEKIDAELKELGKNLKAVHVHDNGIHSDQHIAPYCGKLQLDSIVKGLIDIDYKGNFTFETDAFLNHINGEGPLRQLPLEIRKDGLALIYKIGKFALETYNVYEG